MTARSHHRTFALACAAAAGVTFAQLAAAQPSPAADPPALPAPDQAPDQAAPPPPPPPGSAASLPPDGAYAHPAEPPLPPPSPFAPPSDAARPAKRPWLGGLGYASAAPFFGSLSGLRSALSQPTALGKSYDVPRAGLLLGGGGGMLLFGHLWLGGKGYGLFVPSVSSPAGEAALKGGGGGFELGYVIQPARSLLIPYFGFGGFGYTVRVENRTSAPMPIQGGVTIAPGESRGFDAGFATLEAGLRFQRLMLVARDGGGGGMTAGFEVGFLASLMPGVWKAGETELHEHDSAHLSGGFVRLNIGGGGFWFR